MGSSSRRSHGPIGMPRTSIQDDASRCGDDGLRVPEPGRERAVRGGEEWAVHRGGDGRRTAHQPQAPRRRRRRRTLGPAPDRHPEQGDRDEDQPDPQEEAESVTPYSFSLRLSVERSIPRATAARLWLPPWSRSAPRMAWRSSTLMGSVPPTASGPAAGVSKAGPDPSDNPSARWVAPIEPPAAGSGSRDRAAGNTGPSEAFHPRASSRGPGWRRRGSARKPTGATTRRPAGPRRRP